MPFKDPIKKKEFELAKYYRLKDAAYAAYGGYRCVCCGVTEPVFLTIDHIENDGAEQRKTIKDTYALLRWMSRECYPPGFQILCWNCNYAKTRGECPCRKRVE